MRAKHCPRTLFAAEALDRLERVPFENALVRGLLKNDP
jgi:hypothetical protein